MDEKYYTVPTTKSLRFAIFWGNFRKLSTKNTTKVEMFLKRYGCSYDCSYHGFFLNN